MALEEIDQLLTEKPDAREAALGLVEEALKRNTSDNVSVVLLHWPEPSPKPVQGRQPSRQRTHGRREKILILHEESKSPKKDVGLGLALKVFLIVIPLMFGLVFLLNWVLSR